MKIGNHPVDKYLDPYIIAEIGVNHEGSIDLAKRLICEATESGAHAVKFQSYKAEKIASKYSPAYWDTSKEHIESQYALFKKYDQFEPHHYKELADFCEKLGVDFISTPFDLDAVNFLEPFVPVFKIASADLTNIPLLRQVARSGKPVILSTGASTLAEIDSALSELRRSGAPSVALLHCVLNYPTTLDHAQLGFIRTLKRVFTECIIGYSDHVVPDETISSLECAAMLGSTILEKHFTHDKTLPGNDHYHAMDKVDLKRFCEKLRKYRIMLGKDDEKSLELEAAARKHARRSIVAACNIKAGTVLNEMNLTVKRPAHGLSPLFWDEVIGSIALQDIEEDLPLKWPMILTDGKETR